MRDGPRRAAALLVALALDGLLGEPPERTHPVVAMGRGLAALEGRLPSAPAGRARALGGAAWTGQALGWAAAGTAVQHVVRRAPAPVAVALEGAALWPLLSLRLLLRETAAVETALARSLPEGRTAVARLVSRPTAGLDAAQVREAALSSCAENLVDSVVAPLLAHAVGGLPAAAAYRFANTADAMWGHRDERRVHLGLVAARADDVANLVPARLAGLLLAVLPVPPVPPVRRPAGPASSRVRLRALRVEATRTPSPNGGWPMGALALRLGVRLRKPGVYALHPGGRAPDAADTARALRLVRDAALVAAALAAVVAVGLAAGPVTVLSRPGGGSR
ncbi:adenosylcobinamide-phosphate synthase CbiB [Aquipuribacter sp. SD81]|uniref:adenosylcobinamide-phosphate synthase CbiB n=1 Tax=Aquipuribacter sp. SD81 TaxID=3127703 RepID=UPI0030172663